MATVIIADDDRELGEAIGLVVQSLGHQAIVVNNGRELLDALELHPADLCVVDILMPEMDGLEAIRELRRRYPYLRIIAISGGGRYWHDRLPQLLQLAHFFGAHRTLAKPFGAQELLTTIHELLGLPVPLMDG